MKMDQDTIMGGREGGFPTTMWSSVFELRDRKSPVFQERVSRILTRYWKPIYRTIRITWRKKNEDAKDLTQSFFAKIVEDDLVSKFCSEKGRFRSFLKAALAYFMADDEKSRRRLKRGGGHAHLSLDLEGEFPEIEPEAPNGTPEEVLDREWADALLEEGIRELHARLKEEGRETWYQVYESIDLSSEPTGRTSYRDCARRLSITESDVTHYLHAARRRLRKILLEKVGGYAVSEDEAYDELNHILAG